jgi:Set1/Ash2 histone methyltransferase complex subunit ASH2
LHTLHTPPTNAHTPRHTTARLPLAHALAHRQTINRAMHEAGCAKVDVLEKKEEASPGAALLGDVADDVSADLCILSSECIHSKRVDANLLAEFVNCPLLLLP